MQFKTLMNCSVYTGLVVFGVLLLFVGVCVDKEYSMEYILVDRDE